MEDALATVKADEIERPATVTAACALTWIASTFTLLLGVFVLYGLLADRDEFVDRLSEEGDLQGISPDGVFVGLLVVAVVLMLWCVIAMLLAGAAYRGSRSARILLIVSSGVAAFLSLPGVLVVYPILTLICATAAAVMLGSRSSAQWYTQAKA